MRFSSSVALMTRSAWSFPPGKEGERQRRQGDKERGRQGERKLPRVTSHPSPHESAVCHPKPRKRETLIKKRRKQNSDRFAFQNGSSGLKQPETEETVFFQTPVCRCQRTRPS